MTACGNNAGGSENSSSNTDTQQRDKKKAAENITVCEERSDYTELLRTTENPANGGGRKRATHGGATDIPSCVR
jgi:hypothetical protein